MEQDTLLLEMTIVGILCTIAIIFCVYFYIKYHDDKGYAKARPIILGGTISLSILTTIFEIIWFCMYLGLPV
jgi:heme/copper-type cytochrome/quinol oxidase subunit 2